MHPDAWTIIGAVAALLTSFGFVPQVLRMWRSDSLREVSPLTFYQFTAGLILWTLYGLSRHDPVLVGASLTTLATLVAAVSLYHRRRISQLFLAATFRSALGVGANALAAAREAAHGLVLGVARAGGNIGEVARGALSGALSGARQAGLQPRTGAAAAAAGALDAAVDIGPETVYVVAREIVEHARHNGRDVPAVARETVEKVSRRARASRGDVHLMAARAAAAALEVARRMDPGTYREVQAAVGDMR